MFAAVQAVAAAQPAAAPFAPEGKDSAGLVAELRPARVFLERRGREQIVNFDVLVSNHSSVTYRLVAVKMRVLDEQDRIELERELNENGNPPALDVVGKREVGAGDVLDLFQPFTNFDEARPLHSIQLTLFFSKAGHRSPPAAFSADAELTLRVHPEEYRPAAFCLPMRGRLLVHDGHDLFSHHRRFNLAARYKAGPQTAVSANLYAEDFMVVNEAGELFRGSPFFKRNWLSYGAVIVAPASGTVVETVNDLEENSFDSEGAAVTPPQNLSRDPNGFGNHVFIRHADGRVSFLLHMQPGSVLVHAGASVEAGEAVGRVGFSGDSLFPHLHFNVTDAAAYPSQGVPAYFKNFDRLPMSGLAAESYGQVDSGDLLQSRTCSQRVAAGPPR